jgi:tetratricopeptide (TPR) repeat protein
MSAPRKRMLWLTAVLLAIIALSLAIRQRFVSPREPTATSKLDPLKIREATLTPDASLEAVLAVATQVADAVAAAFPMDPGSLYVQAQVYHNLGRHAAAQAGWRKCVAMDPENAAQYQSAIGFAAITRGDHAEAATAFREALDAGSQDPRVLVQLAGSLMKLGRVDEAVALLEQRIGHQSVSVAALTTLGQGYLELGHCEQALSTFAMALDLDPQDKAACYGTVMASMRLGRQEKAAASMQRFRELESAELWGRVEGLRTFDDQTSTRDIAHRTLMGAARCYRRHGFAEEAVSLLREVAALSPDDVESRLELMTLYEECDDHHQALAVCEQLRSIDPQNADYLMNKGVLLARLGQFDAARDTLQQAIQRDPDNPRYRAAYRVIEQEK